ncbi:MAG: hypothetical protein COT73_09680 [Bdellovibrio sp. CG10_big_fil_rev_8_21_14_0_10_47_8]|nr:MAG: hypothetical protein COT73_09680 [Bdellovibrio sp. CG10_big_fil_rev_8_21_14_0_10_47_8]
MNNDFSQQAIQCPNCSNENCPIKKWVAYKRPQTREERFELAKLMISSGLSVIPVPFGQKFPNIQWKEYQSRLATVQELEKWFKYSENTIGIVTGKISQLVVVDLDSPAAVEWAKQNLLDTAVKVKTHRGQHWYYMYPAMASHIKNKVKIEIGGLFLDIDIRADGGFVMGIGAVHPSGYFYQLIRG